MIERQICIWPSNLLSKTSVESDRIILSTPLEEVQTPAHGLNKDFKVSKLILIGYPLSISKEDIKPRFQQYFNNTLIDPIQSSMLPYEAMMRLLQWACMLGKDCQITITKIIIRAFIDQNRSFQTALYVSVDKSSGRLKLISLTDFTDE